MAWQEDMRAWDVRMGTCAAVAARSAHLANSTAALPESAWAAPCKLPFPRSAACAECWSFHSRPYAPLGRLRLTDSKRRG